LENIHLGSFIFLSKDIKATDLLKTGDQMWWIAVRNFVWVNTDERSFEVLSIFEKKKQNKKQL